VRKLIVQMTLFLGVISVGVPIASNEISPPVEFYQRIPGWTVAGDFEVGACVAIMQTDQRTSLSVASVPNRPELIFSIQNAQWVSIENDAKIRINAIFRVNGKAVDAWSLDAVGMNTEETKPGFRIQIDSAKNDSASFPRQFARSETLEFFNNKIPVSKFALVRSSDAIALLYQCRDQLRANQNFDPFAK
jgi:hypothetical protein